MALPRFTSPALGLLALACGGVSDSSQNSTLNVAFYGFAPTLNGTEAVLWLEGVGRLPYALPAEHTATESAPLPFATLSLSSTDSVHAEAILYSAAQVELARVSTGFRVEARFRYGIGFQAGGRNPDLRGFCHHPPHVLAIPGFPGDSLYLWTSGLPVGAVC